MKRPSMDNVRARIEQLSSIPSIPAILMPLLHRLEEPAEMIDVQKIVELISHDKALAAQTLHMANSPLFGRRQEVSSIKGAVVALGIARVREIASSCCVLKLLPQHSLAIDPRVFWEHSLGCALVARRFARKIGFPDSEKAYIAGLLHDIGIIVNLLITREEFREVASAAFATRVPLNEAEATIFGYDHTFTGELLADTWTLGRDIKEVIRRHHHPERAIDDVPLVALVNLSDSLCRACGLGYGYVEERVIQLEREFAWGILAQHYPSLARVDWGNFIAELDGYVKEVRQLVAALFRCTA